ncbi:MAG: helix-turn-helix domain-containing protein [Clostridia bacterium]|nr:helix-turn-helix domain-containing protein [Clostridia bacterium]
MPDNIEVYKQRILEQLVKVRKSAKLSQKQLEILSGIAQPCIARTEKGATDPNLTTLLKLLEPLGLTLSITQI